IQVAAGDVGAGFRGGPAERAPTHETCAENGFPWHAPGWVALGWVFLFALFTPPPAAAQTVRSAWEGAISQYQLDTWGEAEGLPQLSVFDLAQTPDGYLWVGTEEGLGRYNGAGFTTFDASNEAAFAEGDVIE